MLIFYVINFNKNSCRGIIFDKNDKS